jgi:hypothetical protein
MSMGYKNEQGSKKTSKTSSALQKSSETAAILLSFLTEQASGMCDPRTSEKRMVDDGHATTNYKLSAYQTAIKTKLLRSKVFQLTCRR